MFRKSVLSSVVTTRDLSKVMLRKRIIPVPGYFEKDERELIVIPRGTIYGHKVKKKKTIKL